jgi:hypothetical protein
MPCTLATTDDTRMACFEVLAELRPHLARDRFLDDLRRLGREGYQLAFCRDGDAIVSVAGFRLMETFATGPILYVDDLVTTARMRSRGAGKTLLSPSRRTSTGTHTVLRTSGEY